MPDDDEPFWDRFVIEGDESFDFMIRNFESMFDEGSRIKHFDLRYDTIREGYKTIELYKEHGKDIEQELISWIRTEFDTGRLFTKEKWRPFRDFYLLAETYLGYRHLFQYKQYVFQLVLDCYCEMGYCNTGNCEYCNDGCEDRTHFQLVICGVKDKEDCLVRLHGPSITLHDNTIPDCWWETK
jgi:hypothetical protein